MSDVENGDSTWKETLLKLGDEGAKVASLQQYLHKYGFFHTDVTRSFDFLGIEHAPTVPEEGRFDDFTKRALQAFQRKHGLQITSEFDWPTQRLIKLPRCGVPDTAAYVVDGRKWTNYDLTYGFQELTPDMTAKDVRDAVKEALNLWSSVTLLRFSEVPIANNPDIRIRFVAGDHGDGQPFDGHGGILAHAFYPPPNGGDLAGDAHFDEDETWTISPPAGIDPRDLVSIAAHEFGHSLGLAHSDVSNALMYAYYSGPHRYLHSDDIAGIQYLYNPLWGRQWVGLPGAATDIGIGANGFVWVIGTNKSEGGYGVFRWTGNGWDVFPGAGERIAVAPDGNPWVVNSRHEIYQWSGGGWTGRPGAAKDIGIGKNGAVWVIGTNVLSGGYGIFKWNGSDWDGYPGAAVRIAVGPEGKPWVVNSRQEIYEWTGNSWQGRPGAAFDVGIGADGSVWVIGTNPSAGGFGIFRWNGSSWDVIPGAGIGVSVGPDGKPWVVNSRYEIYQRI